jgi:hypothetical protein
MRGFKRELPGALIGLGIGLLCVPGAAQMPPPPPVAGSWDVVVRTPQGSYPSWFMVEPSGRKALVGQFVGQFGSMRPLSDVQYKNGMLRFSLPAQWEMHSGPMTFEGELRGNRIVGTTTDEKGATLSWEAVRAPSLKRARAPRWGTPIELFNGSNLLGWRTRYPRPNSWRVRNGILTNAGGGVDLITTRAFTDFRLVAEFRYPRGSNSGIYLRGRYEVQIEDNYRQEPDRHKISGIYGFLSPALNAARKPGEWQTMEITLVGRALTVIFNGERVIDRQRIPGITGGALDSKEGQPGPIMLQGDHGPIEFRKLTLIPAR